MDVPHIRIGNQTSKYAEPALGPYEFACKNGFDAFEWFSDKGRSGWCEDDFDAPASRLLRETAAGRDLVFSIHTPYWAAPFDATGAGAIRRSIDCARDIGAAVVNVHLFTEQGPDGFASALRPFLEQAGAAGVRLSLENTPHTTPDDFNAVFDVLAAMPEAAHGRVGMCLDMGHANLCAATHNDYLAYVDQLGGHVPIIHWHAHENWGDRDSHLPLFTGPSAHDDSAVRGLLRRLLARGFRGSVVLEQWPQPPELLVHARDRLREMLTSLAG